jgi:hypothetical protein
MCNILRDFMRSRNTSNGFGYFEGDPMAVKHASSMSKNQIRGSTRYQTVTRAFYAYLKEAGVVPQYVDTSSAATGRTVLDLSSFLRRCPYENGGQRDVAEHIRRLILTSLFPELKKSFAMGDGVWGRLEAGI